MTGEILITIILTALLILSLFGVYYWYGRHPHSDFKKTKRLMFYCLLAYVVISLAIFFLFMR